MAPASSPRNFAWHQSAAGVAPRNFTAAPLNAVQRKRSRHFARRAPDGANSDDASEFAEIGGIGIDARTRKGRSTGAFVSVWPL